MLAVTGSKGGAGATTTALALAAALDGEPLVVDADWHAPDLTRRADRAPGWPESIRTEQRSLSAWIDRLAVRVEPTGFGPARIVAAPDHTSRRLPRIDTLLAACRREPRQVVVDCPTGTVGVVPRAVRLADRLVLVTTHTRRSMEAARRTVRQARAVGTPVVGSVVVRRGLAADGETRPLDPPVLARIPNSNDSPLADGSVRAAYRQLGPVLASSDGAESPDPSLPAGHTDPTVSGLTNPARGKRRAVSAFDCEHRS